MCGRVLGAWVGIVGLSWLCCTPVGGSEFVPPRVFTAPQEVIAQDNVQLPSPHLDLAQDLAQQGDGADMVDALQKKAENDPDILQQALHMLFDTNSGKGIGAGVNLQSNAEDTNSLGGLISNAQLAAAYALAPLILVMDQVTYGVQVDNPVYQELMRGVPLSADPEASKLPWEQGIDKELLSKKPGKPRIPLPQSTYELKKKLWIKKQEEIKKAQEENRALPPEAVAERVVVEHYDPCPEWAQAPDWWEVAPPYMNFKPKWMSKLHKRKDGDFRKYVALFETDEQEFPSSQSPTTDTDANTIHNSDDNSSSLNTMHSIREEIEQNQLTIEHMTHTVSLLHNVVGILLHNPTPTVKS